MRTRRLFRTWTASALLVGALAACKDESKGVVPAGTGVSRGPAQRVILITCDTLRADSVGFGGSTRGVTPTLDALAAESIVFDSAWSAAPLTVPSISALLTGRFPDEVGAGPTNREIMPEDVVTIAEVVRDAGIATAAFVSNGVLRRPPPQEGDVGVQQGFLHFDDVMTAKEKNRDLMERTADACTDAVLAWLAGRDAKDPFFLWVHYQDPHGPYTPPAEHLAPLEHPPIEGERVLRRGADHSGFQQIPKYQLLDGLSTPTPYRDRYDAEIRWFDAQLARLVADLRARGMLDDALLVFTADHGESLGDHDYWFCHGETVNRELVRVPFFVRHPRASLGGATPPMSGARRVAGVVGHVDVWPTIVEAFGLEAPKGRGTSLFANALPEGRVVPQFLGPLLNPNRRLAVTDGRWRAVLVKSEPPRLYDLSNDPNETNDVAALNPSVLVDLNARYTRFMEADARPWSKAVRPALDAARQSELEKLGYAGDGHDGH